MASEREPAEPTNLTGIWNGLFKQSEREHVAFTATLIESGHLVSGSTHEPCIMPEYPRRTHFATLSGTRAGNAVSFIKTYDPPGYGYNTVAYAGTLNREATEIAGQWSIRSGAFQISGDFLMIRAGRMATARDRKARATAKA
jgi:hypothetical protein